MSLSDTPATAHANINQGFVGGITLQGAVGGLTREDFEHLTASSRLDLHSAAMKHALKELPSLDKCSRPYGHCYILSRSWRYDFVHSFLNMAEQDWVRPSGACHEFDSFPSASRPTNPLVHRRCMPDKVPRNQKRRMTAGCAGGASAPRPMKRCAAAVLRCLGKDPLCGYCIHLPSSTNWTN